MKKRKRRARLRHLIYRTKRNEFNKNTTSYFRTYNIIIYSEEDERHTHIHTHKRTQLRSYGTNEEWSNGDEEDDVEVVELERRDDDEEEEEEEKK